MHGASVCLDLGHADWSYARNPPSRVRSKLPISASTAFLRGDSSLTIENFAALAWGRASNCLFGAEFNLPGHFYKKPLQARIPAPASQVYGLAHFVKRRLAILADEFFRFSIYCHSEHRRTPRH